MPNHVTHKLVFAKDKASEIFATCCPEGLFDFETLIPQPPHLYRGNISHADREDFPINWDSWNRTNWGTKWNAYNQSCGFETEKAFIAFDTAWSVPYPVIAAFANRFNAPFEHRYFDEGHNFWGIETWENDDGCVRRTKTRKSDKQDEVSLCLELKGYDPTHDDEETRS